VEKELTLVSDKIQNTRGNFNVKVAPGSEIPISKPGPTVTCWSQKIPKDI